METCRTRIDLAKETFRFSKISNLKNIEEIRFDNCTDKTEIPFTINDYPNIKKLNFDRKSEKALLETLDHLEKFI